MPTPRSYGDACGIARALDVVGERWALLVVRELVLGPKRFTDLRAGLPRLSSEILAQRLRQLEAAGVVARRTLPPPGAARVYELTAWGRELEPVLLALGRFGSAGPPPPPEAPLGVDSTVLALPTLFDATAAAGVDATIVLRLDAQPFRLRVADGRLDVARGEDERPDATIATDPATLAGILWQGCPVAHAERARALAIDGDRRTAERVLALFPLPPGARAAACAGPVD